MFVFKMFLLALCWSSLLLAVTCESPFPSDIPRCHYGDTNCITQATMNIVRQYGKNGYPAVGFPVIEPFMVKALDISDGHAGSLSLKLNFKDISVIGMSKLKLDRTVGFERDPSKSKFELYGSFPKIDLKGKYTADGRILILPITGNGDADITLLNPKFSVKFKPGTHPKDGKTYMTVEKLKVLVEPQQMILKLTNLFNGDPALGEHMNQFLNENWNEVWSELQPSVHVAIAEICKSIIMKMFKKFAYEDLYLED